MIWSVNAILTFVVLEAFFGVVEPLVGMLGRDMTFTGRMRMWTLVKNSGVDHLIGEGYYSFWSSAKAQAIWDVLGPVTSAHNGYLDTYVDGGTIGLCLLTIFLLAAARRIAAGVSLDLRFGVLRFAFLVIAIVHNLTESTFVRLTLLWFSLLLVAIELRRPDEAGEGDDADSNETGGNGANTPPDPYAFAPRPIGVSGG